VIAVRQPSLITFWTLLPGDGRSIAWALTALASIACVAALSVGRTLGSDASGVAGAAVVGAYFAHFTTLPVVTWFEPWGGALALVCVALYLQASRAEGRRRVAFMVGAAAVAALASVVRELMLFLPLVGLGVAFFAPRAEKRLQIAAWGGSLVVAVAALGAHAAAAGRVVVARGDLGTWVGRGGIDPLLSALSTGTRFFAGPEVMPLALGALGIVAAVSLLAGRERLFVVACAVLPLALFLFAWNGAIDVATGKAVNYWGAIVAPLLFAAGPSAITLAAAGVRLNGRREAAAPAAGAA